jgi:hypothetical protein
VGWAETGNAIDRDEYPDGDKREMKNWHGKKDPPRMPVSGHKTSLPASTESLT